jgi:hypothetical protein
MPAAGASAELAEAEVYRAGYDAGMRADESRKNPHPAGSPHYGAWADGWTTGQRDLGARLFGEDPPAKKAKGRKGKGNPEDAVH